MSRRGRSAVSWSPEGVGLDPTGEAAFPDDLLQGAAASDLGVEEVFLAFELARLARPEARSGLRALVLLILASWARLHEGSTRLDLDAGLADFAASVGASDEDLDALEVLRTRLASGRLDPGLAAIVGTGDAYRPLLLRGRHLYHQRLWALERQVAADLAGRLGPPVEPPDGGVEAALADVAARPSAGAAPTDEQRGAVRKALSGGLTVITGGPGTGKTTIVVSLLRVLARLRPEILPRIALAAPTGKAADRMRRAVEGALRAVDDPAPEDVRLLERCPEAVTLHRLLGYAPSADRFRHHRHHPLPADVVIVDEASMVDLHLAGRLVEALPPGARLVLLGDADQLPSVDAGSVLADLCALDDAHVATLTRSFRMRESDARGRAILGTARAVRAGASGEDGLEAWLRGAPEAVCTLDAPPPEGFGGVALLPGAEAREALLERWLDAPPAAGPESWERLMARTYAWRPAGFPEDDEALVRALVGRHEARRILCVTRIEPGSGTIAVNRWFRDRMGGGESYVPGEPVIVTHNDYPRSLFNGDTGVVVRARVPGERRPLLLVVFPRGEGFAAYPVEALRGGLESAWAITVHKAQGSEYDDVALLLPDDDVRLLTREIVYTAVTRARRSVLVVGAPGRLLEAAGRRVRRSSGLTEALLEEVAEEARAQRQNMSHAAT